MANINKIYGTKEQYNELTNFLKENETAYEYMVGDKPNVYDYAIDIKNGETIPIVNLSVAGDVWLALNCDFPWVIQRLKIMYGIKHEIDLKGFRYDMLEIWQQNMDKEIANATFEYEEVKKEYMRQKQILNDLIIKPVMVLMQKEHIK